MFTTCTWTGVGYDKGMNTQSIPQYSNEPFGDALVKLIARHQGHPWKVSIQGFAEEADINYGTLRSAVVGRTMPAKETIEKVARALKVSPTHFREYRAYQMGDAIKKATDHNPEVAGKFYEFIMAETAALDELDDEQESPDEISPSQGTPESDSEEEDS